MLKVISCNKNICTLQITDTTGSHQFPAMQRLNISKGHAFILVFSVTSKQSLEELKPIYNVIREVKATDSGYKEDAYFLHGRTLRIVTLMPYSCSPKKHLILLMTPPPLYTFA
ncbi:GTP-binding protein Di-Ras2-like [Tropilaelaps mercedesae]|uniref:GTP-binding protein Di-Ras2-like n=1 Tax=Tropilaelaps mercedesae TaxID=418985 RepID=A0A1V9XX51_9ACAR|nr:GTP-binding protein Di-Ras2-like [Tropilaelaps mercedesae]